MKQHNPGSRLTHAIMSVLRYTLLLSGLPILLTCGEDESSKCRPTRSSCSGDPCTYVRIYDSNGDFVHEGDNTYWNGMDCNGQVVPCGAYRVEVTMVQGGRSVAHTAGVLVADSTSESASGVNECAALRASCQGTYSEAIGAEINEFGVIEEAPIGVCCE